MDFKELKGLCEAYTTVYDENINDELEEILDEFAGIENLTDEEIDEIVEETIEEMLDEGYEFDEVEEIFEEVILEMNPYAPAGSKAARQYAKSTSASKRGAERAEKIAQVKGAVKSALGRVRDTVRDARKGVSKRIDSAKSSATQAAMRATNVKPSDVGTDKRGRPLNKGNFDTRYSKNRAKARKAIGTKIASKISGAVDRVKTVGAGVASAAASAPGAAQSAVKRGIRGAALNVARKMKEGFDVYDIVLEHLIVEGYADTLEQAEAIMVNMSEEWRDEIIDEAQIMSVSGKGGLKYMVNPKIVRAQNAAARERQGRQERKNQAKNTANVERSAQARKKSIQTLNAKPGADSGDYDSGYHGDDDTSDGKRHYSLSRTNRSARKRRASGT